MPKLQSLLACLPGLLFSCAVTAQDYPVKPITIIVPLGPGSTVDIIARVVGAGLTHNMHQPVKVELLPGAGGTIGTAKAARAAPDGYTLTIASNGTHAINMGLYSNPGYDPVNDFAPIALVGSVTNVMIVGPDNPAKTPQDVIAAARARPGVLTYSSGGVGTTHHFSGLLFANAAHLDLKHVPYQTSIEGINQVMAGNITMGFFNLPTVLAQIKAEKLKGLAVTSRARSSYLPQLPTLEETGLKGYEVTAWFGFVAPAGTPGEIINKLNAEIGSIMTDPAVMNQLTGQGFEIGVPTPPAAFAHLIESDLARWLDIVKASGAKAL